MDTAEPALICSAKGCRTPAVWVLAWNNPKLHTPERRKTWLACAEHREYLSQFLGVRGFLKEVVTLTDWQDAEKSAARDAEQGAGNDSGNDAGDRPGPERG